MRDISDHTSELDSTEPVHEWFNLTYASYLVLPRSILQSCSVETQRALVRVLADIDREAGQGKISWPEDGQSVEVRLRGADGKLIVDDLADYQRGRRRLFGKTD